MMDMGIDKNRVRFILNKQQIKTIVIIFILVFIASVFFDVSANPYPPKMVFVDGESNEMMDGDVLIEGDNFGRTNEGVFTDLPDYFLGRP